jgi:hypothetical protein
VLDLIRYLNIFYLLNTCTFFILNIKINEILTKYNIYNFGGMIPNREELDLNSAYSISKSNNIMLIMLPNNGN